MLDHNSCATDKPDKKYWIFGEGKNCHSLLINYENDANCQSHIEWLDISQQPANIYPYVTDIRIYDNGKWKYFNIDNKDNKDGIWGGYCSSNPYGQFSKECCGDGSSLMKFTNIDTHIIFSCPMPALSPPPEESTGYYQCTNNDSNTATKDGKTYNRVNELITPGGHIPPHTDVTTLTKDPSICNLSQDLVYMRRHYPGGSAYQHDLGNGSRPVCQMLKCPEPHQNVGWNTVHHQFSKLNPYGESKPHKPAVKWESVSQIYIPTGVNAQFYDDHDNLKYVIDCTSASEHKDPHHKFPNNDKIGPGATEVSAFEGGCYKRLIFDERSHEATKMYITLQKSNPNACDSYSYPEPFNFSHTLNPENSACP